MISKDLVLTVLVRHVGEDRGVHIEHLVTEIRGTSERDQAAERRVRALVSELRAEGIAICAHPGKGYFIAETPQEIELCCQFLRARALHSLTLESKLRRIPLPELLGQMRLKT